MFDPYSIWFDIPAEEQPPDHYRLLGVRPFESDPKIIQSAIDNRVAFLQDVSHGNRVQYAQQLLNEVAQARVCLFDSKRKEAYDKSLRQNLNPSVANIEKPVKQPLENKSKGFPVPIWLMALMGVIVVFIVGGVSYLIFDLQIKNAALKSNDNNVVPSEPSTNSPKSNPETQTTPAAVTNDSNVAAAKKAVDDFSITPPTTEDFKSFVARTPELTTPFDSALGKWAPGKGVAFNMIRDPNQIHLHLYGGPDHSITLQLDSKLEFPAILELNVERWTVKDPLGKNDYFQVHTSANNQDWILLPMTKDSDTISVRSKKGPVPWHISYELNDPNQKFIRLTCNSTKTKIGEGGILIGQVTFRPVLPLPKFGK